MKTLLWVLAGVVVVLGLMGKGLHAAEGGATTGAAGNLPTIFICGDSTAKYAGNETAASEMQGWGTPLAQYFAADKVRVNNVAHAGTSSRTYYNGDWPRVLGQIKTGDYVLLVFGINDGTTLDGIGDQTRPAGTVALRGATTVSATTTAATNTGATNPATTNAGAVEHTYGWYMSKMATDAMAKGAHPYFLTVTTRNIWTNPKVQYRDATPINPLPADYDPRQDKIERGTGNGRFTLYTKQVGQKIHVPVFDLTNCCADLYEQMGREAVNKFYKDHNHTYAAGAEFVATTIASGLKAFKESPFVGLMSEKGKALPAAEGKYVSENRE